MVYYGIDIRSDDYKEVKNSFESVEALKTRRVIKDTDGAVSYTVPAQPLALFIDTSLPVEVSINGAADITIEGPTLLRITDLSSLSISCSDTDGAVVTTNIWGQ